MSAPYGALEVALVSVAAILFSGVVLNGYMTRRQRAIEALRAAEERRAEVALSSIADAVLRLDAGGRIVYANPAAESLCGLRATQMQGRSIREVVQPLEEGTLVPLPCPPGLTDPEKLARVSRRLAVLAQGTKPNIHIELNITPLVDRGTKLGSVVVMRDITASMELERRLRYQARHDPLTGLLNRTEFETRVTRAIESAKRRNIPHAVLYLDLDQFKIINDTSGHDAGDELLRQVSSLLAEQLRPSDTLARLGGDEFGVLLADCPPDQVVRIGERILQAVRDFRFGWETQSFSIGVSIGVVPLDSASPNLRNVLKAADTACYAAKDGGRDRLYLYTLADKGLLQREGELDWVSRIQAALETDGFTLYAQRIRRLTGEAAPHYEILVRMLGENGKIIPPMAFIPAAERYGLMPKIDAWVFEAALGLIGRHAGGSCDKTVWSINLSGQSMADETFLRSVMERVRNSETVSPAQLCFEVTETAAISNFACAQNFLKVMHSMGCLFSLDDFGSGVSSFGYLRKLQVDHIKIDGAFVRNMLDDKINYAMVASITHIGKLMGKTVIAEFVPDEATCTALRTLGVDYAQGYGIHVPEPLETVLSATGQCELPEQCGQSHPVAGGGAA